VEDISARNFQDAVKACGGAYVPPSGAAPPMVVGSPSLKVFYLVMTMHGLDDFEKEYAGAKWIALESYDVKVPVLSADRVIKSKETVNRDKDRAVLPTLRDFFRTMNF
jgi:hypothetical protein